MNLHNNKYLYLSLLLALSSCGGGSSSPPSPVITLTASSEFVLVDSSVTIIWSSSNTSNCKAYGAWSGSKATTGNQEIIITSPGANIFNISCSGSNGSRSASVTVEGYRETTGASVDGYIRQADIFIDTNNSYTADENEVRTISDNNGKFIIKYSNGNLVSLGGTDLDSGNALDNLLLLHKLTGHSNFKAITPITSVAAFMKDSSLVHPVLGIDLSLDILTFDPVAGKGDGGINDYLYEKGSQLTVIAYALQNMSNNLNSTSETTQDFFKAIAQELDSEYAITKTKVNIETEAFITKVTDNIIAKKKLIIAKEARKNIISALASVITVMEVRTSEVLSTAVFGFATSTLQNDIQSIANGSAEANVIKIYEENIFDYIAADQDVDAAMLAQ